MWVGQQQKLAFPSQENNSAHSFFPPLLSSTLLFLSPSCSSSRTQLARSHPLKLAPARPANSARVVLAGGRLRNPLFLQALPHPSAFHASLEAQAFQWYLYFPPERTGARTDAGFSSANVGCAPAPPLAIGPSPRSRDPRCGCVASPFSLPPLLPPPLTRLSAVRLGSLKSFFFFRACM